MVEGGGTKDFAKIKGLMFSDSQALHLLLEKNAKAVASYLNAQIEAGAQAVMVFDTWGVYCLLITTSSIRFTTWNA